MQVGRRFSNSDFIFDLAKYQVAGAKDAFIRSKHHFFRNSCRHRPRGGPVLVAMSLVPIVVSFIVSVLPVGFLTSAAILVVKVLAAVAAFVFVVVFLQTFFSFPLFIDSASDPCR